MKRFGFLPILFVLGLVVPLLPAAAVKATEKVIIAASQGGLVVWIAQDSGYFEEEGLDVELKLFQSGLASADAVLAGEADLSTTAESAFVSRSLEHRTLRILASIASKRNVRLVGRKDRGILEAQDLTGKRIGVTVGSTAEFFLGRYLTLNSLSLDEVEIVDMKPAELSAGLISGELDAALTWDPFMYRAERVLGDKAAKLPDQEGMFYYFLLVGQANWIEAKPDVGSAVLRALVRAENLVIERPERAKRLVQERFEYDDAYLEHIWPLHSLHISLPQDLLFLMEEQARWRIRHGLTQQSSVPNYLDFIAIGPLKDTKSSAVSILY